MAIHIHLPARKVVKSRDAYRGSFTIEFDKPEYDRYKVGQETVYKGSKVKVEKKTLTEKKKSSSGELIPEKFLVSFQTVDGGKSFEEVRNDPEGRRLIDAIEDTISSLEGKKDDKILEGVLARQKAELKRKFGYVWRDGVRDAPNQLPRAKVYLEELHADGYSMREAIDKVLRKFEDVDESDLKKVWPRKSKDAPNYLPQAKAATIEANNKTKEATRYGSPHNHTQASIAHYAAGMSWANVANASVDPNEKAEAKKKSDEHRRQSDFHYKNSIA